MTVYEQLDNVFNEASPVEKCKIADKLDAMAKKFNKYIDENYYPCPHCFKVIPYGEAIEKCDVWEETVCKNNFTHDFDKYEYETATQCGMRHHCPHCNGVLWQDYAFRLYKK